MNKALLTLLLTIFPLAASAESRVVSRPSVIKFGIEWGAAPAIAQTHKFVYTDEDLGYLHPCDQSTGFCFHNCGYILLNLGANITECSSVQIESGFSGIYANRRVFPIQLRYTLHPNGSFHDGTIFHIASGIGIPDDGGRKPALLGQAGAGYRLSLSRNMSVDIIGALKFCYDHPPIFDEDLQKYVSERNIRKNDAGYCALSVGIALNF